jgi:FKBP-type peptidyl-prolyl cis-trans isomerase
MEEYSMLRSHHKGHHGHNGKRSRHLTFVSLVSFVVTRGVLLLAVASAAACGSDPAPTQTSSGQYSQTDLVVGTGATAVSGSQVTVTYTGWLYDTSRTDGKGTQFDTNQVGFPFRLGTGVVIAGWDRGVAGMRVGGQRRLVIPPELAYGSAGRPPQIPSNATLVFDVALLNVQ